jgi:hypothetical protein
LTSFETKNRRIPNSTFTDNDLESLDVVSIVDDENNVLQEM